MSEALGNPGVGAASKRRGFRFQDLLVPVVQAPMGGSGITTSALVLAACEAGVLGSIAAAYCTVEELERDVQAVRAGTTRSFAINLFAPTVDPPPPVAACAELDRLKAWHDRLGLPAPLLPEVVSEPFEAMMEAILALHPDVVSCTFGLLSPQIVGRLQATGVFVMGTATTVREARMLEEAGFNAVIAQGAEAGGHRGGFLGAPGGGMIGTMALVPQVVDALHVPVVASGGIMDGRGIAAALALGAAAVQMGTAFLATEESGAPRCYKDKVLSAADDTTVITRAFSGRPARGIANLFTEEAERIHAEPLPYPWQNALTRPLRKAGIARGDPEVLSLWAGQGSAMAKERTVKELVSALHLEMDNAVLRLPRRTPTGNGTFHLGVVGGLGPGAASCFYRELAKDPRVHGEVLGMTMVHADLHRVLGHVSRAEKRELAVYLGGLMAQLQASGAEWAAIPAVTPHYCLAELKAISPLPFTNIMQATRDELRVRGMQRVSVFGSRFVMETKMFGALADIAEIILPAPDEIEAVHSLYLSLVQRSKGTEEDKAVLTQIATGIIEREGLDAVVLGGTDFAVVPEGELPFPNVDCFAVYVNAVFRDLGSRDEQIW